MPDGRKPFILTASLAERKKGIEARKAITDGVDPFPEKKRAIVVAQFTSVTLFKDVAQEWLAKGEREERPEVTLDKDRWPLSMA